MTIPLPEKVRVIINTLEKAGFEAFIVGGCVRDALLKRTPNDWDITTNALPEEVKRLFPATVDTGIAHGTVSILMKGESFEVTTYRVDGLYEDARHPKEVHFSGELREDLRRRDFTINAMAYHEVKGLVDPFGGQKDLENGVICCVGDPKERFSEDALRIMRCVRFAAQLDFSIEEETKKALSAFSGRLGLISAERIRMELEKLLTSAHPEKLRLLYETGQTAVFLPEFDLCMETPQNNRHHCYTVGEHTLKTLMYVPEDPVLRMAMLLHDIGKPACRWTDDQGEDHFTHHPERGAEISRTILKRLKFDNRRTEQILRLVRFHDDNPPPDDEGAVRKAMARCTREAYPDLFYIKRADAKGKHPDYVEAELSYIDRYQEVCERILSRGDALSVAELSVNGRDLIAHGMERGKRIGEALHTALSAVLKRPEDNKPETLLKLLKKAGFFCIAVFLSLGLLTGCSLNRPSKTQQQKTTEAAESEAEEPEYEEEPALLSFIDTKERKIGLRLLGSTEEKICSYNENTLFCDKYDGLSTLASFQPGEIVNYRLFGGKRLEAMKISNGIERIDRLKKYEIDEERGIFSFEGANYKLDPTVPVYLGDENVTLKGIDEGDELRVCLRDKDVCSMRITTGYGTIVLKNTEVFDGGYLNMDNSTFLVVSPGMEIETVEGKHEITVANDGYGDSILVNVLRNEAVAVDLSALKGEGPKFCELTITVLQPEAEVLLDGARQDVSSPLSVRYGTHRLTVRLEGYDPWSRTLVANSKTASIEIDLTGAGASASAAGEPETETGTEAASLASQIIEAAQNGTRPSEAQNTAPITDTAGAAATEEDFSSAYLDTLSSMFSALSDTGDKDDD